MSSPTTLLVTVGSTLFTALTNEVLSDTVLPTLPGLGFERLIVQYGAADLVLSDIKGLDLNAQGAGEFTRRCRDGPGKIVVQVMRYTDDFNGLVASADAVISHAGGFIPGSQLQTAKPRSSTDSRVWLHPDGAKVYTG